jgi:hypothetical protein
MSMIIISFGDTKVSWTFHVLFFVAPCSDKANLGCRKIEYRFVAPRKTFFFLFCSVHPKTSKKKFFDKKTSDFKNSCIFFSYITNVI